MRKKLGGHAWFTLGALLTAWALLFGSTWWLVKHAESFKRLAGCGSDTMAPLVDRWAASFLEGKEATAIGYRGGGSQHGLGTYLYQEIDFFASSRELSAQERGIAKARGFEPVVFVVAWDGLAIVVHPSSPVESLTLDHVRRLFAGDMANWKAAGGHDEPVQCFARDKDSGTETFFAQRVLQGDAYAPATRHLATNVAIVEAVARTVGGIGFVGLEHAREARGAVKIVALAGHESEGSVLPAADTILSGAYPLARPLRLYTRGQPEGLLGDFVRFCRSEDGQRIAAEAGYLPEAALESF